jgi:hypothetical protein
MAGATVSPNKQLERTVIRDRWLAQRAAAPTICGRPCVTLSYCCAGNESAGDAMNESWLLWGLLFGSIGLGYFIYGKRQRAVVPLVCGLALMIFP